MRDDVLERRPPARSRLPAAVEPLGEHAPGVGVVGAQHGHLLVGGDGVGVVAELAIGGAEAEPGVGAQLGDRRRVVGAR